MVLLQRIGRRNDIVRYPRWRLVRGPSGGLLVAVHWWALGVLGWLLLRGCVLFIAPPDEEEAADTERGEEADAAGYADADAYFGV